MKKMQLPRLLLAILAGILSVASNVFANWITPEILSANLVFLIICILAVIVAGIVYFLMEKEVVRVRLKTSHALRTEAERKRDARRGMILLMSLYAPQHENQANQLSPTERQQAVKNKDYQKLDLPHSNLATTIAAIKTHASKLEHIWLLSTCSSNADQPGSDVYIPVLIHYLQDQLGITCHIHSGPNLSIPLDDDASITGKTQAMVNSVYQEANTLGLKDEDLIADVTSGTRAFMMGIVLACLDGNRKLQFMGVHYGNDAKPTGELFPILFDYEIKIENDLRNR